ncbi:type II secretion system F family protein [Candidatus Magnetominusculus dajiuhuensis]|uniref:type II secretion system F family protein n=1 Tax=Candidatus Magnetominusculus dajiuhuensis TaxID=3137712 RepID=UPI003B436A1D
MEGDHHNGVINAPDEEIVISSLKDSRLIPLSITRSEPKGKIEIFKRSGSKEVLTFTTELAALLGAGLALDRSLSILVEVSDNNTMRSIIQSILKTIREGSSFSESLSKHPKVFTRLYINMIKAAEAGGVIEAVMEKLADYLETSGELKEHIYSAMIYPVLLGVTGLVSVLILLTYVIPQFAKIFEEMGEALPLPTQILMTISAFFSGYWWAVVGIIVVSFFAYRRYSRTEEGRYNIDSFKLRVFRGIVTTVETARFSRTLGTLLKSGVPLLEALRNVKDVINNLLIRGAIEGIISGAKEGKGLAGPLSAAHIFPPLAISMMKVGEETGALDEMLLKTASTYEKTLRTMVRRLISILEPAMILIMAVVVAFIVISMLLAIFSLNDIPM